MNTFGVALVETSEPPRSLYAYQSQQEVATLTGGRRIDCGSKYLSKMGCTNRVLRECCLLVNVGPHPIRASEQNAKSKLIGVLGSLT